MSFLDFCERLDRWRGWIFIAYLVAISTIPLREWDFSHGVPKTDQENIALAIFLIGSAFFIQNAVRLIIVLIMLTIFATSTYTYGVRAYFESFADNAVVMHDLFREFLVFFLILSSLSIRAIAFIWPETAPLR